MCMSVIQDSQGVYPVVTSQRTEAVIVAFFLPVNTGDVTYIIILHHVDASVLTTQR